MTHAIVFAGIFATVFLIKSARDHRFYKRHRILTLEQDRMVRSWSYTPGLNLFDSAVVTAFCFACYMAFVQVSG